MEKYIVFEALPDEADRFSLDLFPIFYGYDLRLSEISFKGPYMSL